MPTITALQMATASLAVPKSVMKTITGRGAELGEALTEALASGCGLAHPTTKAQIISRKTPIHLLGLTASFFLCLTVAVAS